MITAIKGMGKAYLKAKKAKAQKRFDEINKEVSKSKNKKATIEAHIDEVGKLYKEMD